MIDIITFRTTVLERIRSGTSGYFDDDTFIDVTNQKSISVARKIANFYEQNQSAKDALRLLVTPKQVTLSAGGVLSFEEDYIRFLGVMDANNGKTAYPINVNEVPIINKSKIRGPKLTGPIYYYQTNDEIHFLPGSTYPVYYNYLREPVKAKLVMNEVSTADSDYLEPSTTPGDKVDLEWPNEMFDLLLYSVLQELGFELKDELILQYSQMGIAMEQLNVAPQ